MAEQIKVAELTIDPKKLLKELERTKTSIDDLTQSQKELRKSGDTSSETFIKNEAQIKKLRKEYNGQIKTLQAVTGGVDKLKEELDKEVKSIREAKDQNQALRRIRDEINTETEEGQELLKKLNDRIDENTGLTKKNTDAISKQKSNVGNYTESINKAKISVRAFGGALKAAGIGLAVAAFAALSQAVGENKKVMLVLNTVMNAFSSVVQPIISAVVDGATAAYKATGGFAALSKVVGALITLGLTPLKVAFYAVKDAILSAQLGYEKLFGSDEKVKEITKDLEENRKQLKEVRTEAAGAGKDLVENMTKAIGESIALGKSIGDNVGGAMDKISEKNIWGNAFDVAAFKQEVEKIDAEREKLQLTFQRDAEKLRQIRDDETLSIKERQKANDDLIALQNQQIKDEQALINKKIAGYKKMLEINADDVDAQVALMQSKTELVDVEERVTGTMSEGLVERNNLRKDEEKQTKESEDKKTQTQIDAEKKRQEKIEELKNQFRDKEKEKKEEWKREDIEKFYKDQEAEIERLIEDDALKAEMLANLRAQRDERLAEYDAKQKEKETKKLQEDVQAYADAQQKKLNLKKQAVDQVASLFGEETAVAKAALVAKQILAMKEWAMDQTMLKSKQSNAIAEATVDNAKGQQKTAASAPFPWNIPLIIGYIAQTAGLISTIKGALNMGGKSKPQFAQGGNIFGPSHYGGGVDIEAEGGESIINKRSTAKYGGLLSAINMAEGGKPIIGGNQAPSGLIDYERLGNEVARANLSLPPQRVAIDEIRQAESRTLQIEERARF